MLRKLLNLFCLVYISNWLFLGNTSLYIDYTVESCEITAFLFDSILPKCNHISLNFGGFLYWFLFLCRSVSGKGS